MLSVKLLEYMHDNENIPEGAKKLFWGFISPLTAFSIIDKDERNRYMESYWYCCDLYFMRQLQPGMRAVPTGKVDEKGNKEMTKDPIRVIIEMFNEMIFLYQGAVMVELMFNRSIGGLNLKLMSPKAFTPSLPPTPKTPGRLAKFLGKD